MTFTFGLSRQFAAELPRLLPDQKEKIQQFLDLYLQFGLADQTKYPGRLSPSWHRLPTNHPNHQKATEYSLWHYHAGLEQYTGNKPWGNTSDWLIHFQWVDRGNHIDLVDMNRHYTSTGDFYIPSASGGRLIANSTPTEPPAADKEAPT